MVESYYTRGEGATQFKVILLNRRGRFVNVVLSSRPPLGSPQSQHHCHDIHVTLLDAPELHIEFARK